MHFSVLISVYNKENPHHLDRALASIVNQTKIPSQIVLVKDGILTADLNAVIERYDNLYRGMFTIVPLLTNQGLGDALNEGLKQCSYEWIARMDSDDICIENRFEIQIDFINKHKDISVTGGYIEEFIDTPGDLKRIKKVPLSYQEVKIFAKKRNPLSHPSVMFRKSAVENVGGYERMLFFEDYFLWLKLIKAGYKIANTEQVLLYFQVGNDMIGRRHGLPYAKHELNFAQQAKNKHFFHTTDMIRFVSTRFPIRLLPKPILKFLYRNLVRK